VKHPWLLIALMVALSITARVGAAGSETMASGPARDAALAGQAVQEQSTPGDNAADNGRLAAVLPPGMSSQEACRGLKSLDLCAATLHAAQNLNLPFAQLKRQVAAGQGLDAAIHAVRPAADAGAEATRAQEQAQQDMRAPRG
jgi:hypothetical protein